jgi:hypothetical protein
MLTDALLAGSKTRTALAARTRRLVTPHALLADRIAA